MNSRAGGTTWSSNRRTMTFRLGWICNLVNRIRRKSLSQVG